MVHLQRYARKCFNGRPNAIIISSIVNIVINHDNGIGRKIKVLMYDNESVIKGVVKSAMKQIL